MVSSEKDIWSTTAHVEKKPEARGKGAKQDFLSISKDRGYWLHSQSWILDAGSTMKSTECSRWIESQSLLNLRTLNVIKEETFDLDNDALSFNSGLIYSHWNWQHVAYTLIQSHYIYILMLVPLSSIWPQDHPKNRSKDWAQILSQHRPQDRPCMLELRPSPIPTCPKMITCDTENEGISERNTTLVQKIGMEQRRSTSKFPQLVKVIVLSLVQIATSGIRFNFTAEKELSWKKENIDQRNHLVLCKRKENKSWNEDLKSTSLPNNLNQKFFRWFS